MGPEAYQTELWNCINADIITSKVTVEVGLLLYVVMLNTDPQGLLAPRDEEIITYNK